MRSPNVGDDLPQIGAHQAARACPDHPLMAQQRAVSSNSSTMPRAGPMSRRSIGSRRPARPTSGSRVVAPLDEFYARIITERRTLFALALGLRRLPRCRSRSGWGSRDGELAAQAGPARPTRSSASTRRPAALHSVIAEIDELGRSVFTMRSRGPQFRQLHPRPIVRQLIETGTSLRLGGYTARGHGAVHRRRERSPWLPPASWQLRERVPCPWRRRGRRPPTPARPWPPSRCPSSASVGHVHSFLAISRRSAKVMLLSQFSMSSGALCSSFFSNCFRSVSDFDGSSCTDMEPLMPRRLTPNAAPMRPAMRMPFQKRA